MADCITVHRPVKDLAWSPELPDVLATAGLDGALHIWDVRSHQAPCQSFAAGPSKPAHLVRAALLWNPSHNAAAVWDPQR
jgi:WD40 repeat protein